MYKKVLTAAVLLGAFAAPASAAGDILINDGGIVADGTQHMLADRPFRQAGVVYVPLDDSLSRLGYTLGWNVNVGATVVEKTGSPDSIVFPSGDTHIIGYGMYRYLHPVIDADGKCFIDTDLFSDLTGSGVIAEQSIGGMRIPDTYRAEGGAEEYDGIYVLDRSYMFEPSYISEESAAEYAEIVNRFAETLPEVRVYNMLVPDSSEYYAPIEYYKDQLTAFEHVYDGLKNVTPVPVGDMLLNHAGESIYFTRDHHWTQRGAYYAWKRFMELRGEEIDDIDSFDKIESYDFVGSFVKELDTLGASDAIDERTEYFERFLPKYEARADVYDDMLMQQYASDVPLVDPENNGYGCFIYGDTPLTVITGGVQNGRSIAIFKESMGNALATWAVNNYEKVLVVDIRAYRDGSFDLRTFYEMQHFDDLLVESYPATIESEDLREGLASLD